MPQQTCLSDMKYKAYVDGMKTFICVMFLTYCKTGAQLIKEVRIRYCIDHASSHARQ